MKAIRELGYTPNAFARSFRTGKKNIIGFVVPDISNQFFARLIEAVEESISAEGFHLIIANTRENKERERQHLRYLTSGVVDGILLASTMETYGEFSDFLPEQFPAVLVDRKVDAAPFSSVTVSAYQSVYKSVAALIEQGQRRIGFITGLSRLGTSRERLAAYRQAMSDFGLTIEEDFRPARGLHGTQRVEQHRAAFGAEMHGDRGLQRLDGHCRLSMPSRTRHSDRPRYGAHLFFGL